MSKYEEIIEAAIPMFASNGIMATSTTKIAEAAEVTQPLIYHHFRYKERLFLCCLNQAFKEQKVGSTYSMIIHLVLSGNKKLLDKAIRENPELDVAICFVQNNLDCWFSIGEDHE